MERWTEWTPSSHSRRWKRRKKSNAVVRAWLWVISFMLAVVAVVLLGHKVESRLTVERARQGTMAQVALSVFRRPNFTAWEQSVSEALEQAVAHVGNGDITQAGIFADKVTSLLKVARLKRESPEQEFFPLVVSGLDRIWNQRPDNSVLLQHVTQARIELATFRSALDWPQSAGKALSTAPLAKDSEALPLERTGTNEASMAPSNGRLGAGLANRNKATSSGPAADATSVAIFFPRKIAPNTTLNPAALGRAYLDARALPEAAEILVPPERRSFEDNVFVEDLTIAGGAQKIDGIRWANVTFVGTRVQYEKGPIDLENVRFVRCTFGFSAGERGARLADAIALGQTTFTAE